MPAHWLAFAARTSPLTASPRTAADPVNAVLNYLYALLEAEVRIACLKVGLDPGLGVLHADQKARDSLALDLMEATRPAVDAYVLDLLASRVFSREDLFETRQGQCRLLPSLTEQLTATTGTWAKAVAPWAEWTAKRMLTGGSEGSRIALPTPLTGANRRIGRGLLPTATAAALPKPAAICRECGLALEDQRRRSCPVCLPQVKMRVSTGFLEAGPAELARLRANNADPAHGGNAGRARGKRNANHIAANAAWTAEQGSQRDPELFRREILPLLQSVSLGAMARATGLSVTYCGLVRRGVKIPHPRHWEVLGRLDDER